jgi:hypothetical protein
VSCSFTLVRCGLHAKQRLAEATTKVRLVDRQPWDFLLSEQVCQYSVSCAGAVKLKWWRHFQGLSVLLGDTHNCGNSQLGTKSVPLGHSFAHMRAVKLLSTWLATTPMVLKRRPTYKPGEPLLIIQIIGTEVVARYLVSMTLSALLWSLHLMGNGPHTFRIYIDDWCSWCD